MKAKLKPTRHGKWSLRKEDSIEKKMTLVRELFNLCGTELDTGALTPKISFVKFYGNQRRFVLDEDARNIYINELQLKSRNLDYVILCAICFFYTEKHKESILGGEVTLVDLHSCIDFSDSLLKDIMKTVARDVTAVVLTKILINLITRL